MKQILHNPYRTLGLLVGASAAQQNKHIKRIPKYIDAGGELPEEFTAFSFPVLGKIKRSVESVSEAASLLGLDNDKMNAALFWFYNGNAITDEVSFDALKDGNVDLAIEIWRKLAYDADDNSYNEVTKRNASAFHNLSTLYLQQYGIDEDTLHLKLLFLESNFSNELKNKATDEKYKISKKELQLLFLNSLTNKKGFEISEFIDAISGIEFVAKEDFLKGFVQKPIEQLEKKIEESKSKRKANKANSIKAANSLLADTKESIKQLKSILGVTNIKYSSIADKLAMEFFACGRDYFMHFKDSDKDPSDYSMKLFKNAKSYAVGNIAKQQIDENIKDLKEWIDDKPERDKQKLIEEDLKFITSKLERFQNLNDTITNAKELVESCKTKLFSVRTSLGRADEFYLKISGAVVNNAQGMLVSVVNDEQELFKFAVNPSSANIDKVLEIAKRRHGANGSMASSALTNLLTDRYKATENLKTAIKGALSVSRTLGELDMDTQLKTRYHTNNSTLLSLASQLGIGSTTTSSRSTTTSSRSTTTSSRSTTTHRPTVSSSPQSDFEFAPNAWWILGLIGLVIGAIAGGGGGALAGALVGGSIGTKFL